MKPKSPMRMFRCCLMLLLAAATLGCRHGGIDLPTGRVSGTVTCQGKPLGFGTIVFFHPSGHAASAEIAADGTFTLTAYQGPNQISIECYEADRPGSTKVRSRTGHDKSLIPQRYTNYTSSGLAFEVKAGECNKADFTLGN
jgi:hypothetical protein